MYDDGIKHSIPRCLASSRFPRLDNAFVFHSFLPFSFSFFLPLSLSFSFHPVTIPCSFSQCWESRGENLSNPRSFIEDRELKVAGLFVSFGRLKATRTRCESRGRGGFNGLCTGITGGVRFVPPVLFSLFFNSHDLGGSKGVLDRLTSGFNYRRKIDEKRSNGCRSFV